VFENNLNLDLMLFGAYFLCQVTLEKEEVGACCPHEGTFVGDKSSFRPLLRDDSYSMALIPVAKVSKGGVGEQQNLDLKLILSVFFENICEFHKMTCFIFFV
jgi:hypothetical protein